MANQSYKGKTYTLEETIHRSVGYWCNKLVRAADTVAWNKTRDTLAEVHNAFYPSIGELTQTAQQKIAAAQAKIEEIWNGADGFRGVSRYVARVVTNALIDEKRRRETQKRKPEILAVSLDEPVSVTDDYEGTEETSTLGDTISGEVEIDLPFAFAFEELRGEMTDEEYRVLESAIKTGATISELAEQRGESKSTTGRIAKSAKRKSRKWIKGLRRGPHQRVKARFLRTLGWGSSLRPDHISREVLESWNTTVPTVPFHDEASEWHAPITKKPRERARRECWNLACANGLAIGPDNLVLPTARRNEAVRYLPAVTGKVDRRCAGCEAAKRAKVLQSVDTKTAFQIGDAELNVRAIPATGQSADGQYHDRQEQAPHFFGSAALSRTSGATKGNRMHATDLMDHKQAAEIIKAFDIPRSTVARLARMHLSDVSSWLNGNLDFSQEKIERISQVVADIANVVQTLVANGIKPDLRDVDNVKHLIGVANDTALQMDLALDGQPEPLRIIPMGETGAAAD